MLDVGEALGLAAPAASPATSVPWPLTSGRPPSPAPVKSTDDAIRPPKSALRDVSTPESTMAMPGAFRVSDDNVTGLRSELTPVASGQIRPDVTLCPRTRPFGVIERTDVERPSAMTCEPVRSAITPL